MKKIVALVLAMVMVLGLATTAFAAKAGSSFDTAKVEKDWDFVVTAEDAADEKDATFATYTIEATAKKNGAVAFWATLTNVEKGDKEDVEINGEDEFVKVANAELADVVVVDGKTVTYYAVAEWVNETLEGWAGKASKVTLPAKPVDNADYACNTIYSTLVGVPATVYFYEDDLWVADATNYTDVLNVDGVAVFARVTTARDYYYTGHEYEVEYKSLTHPVAENATKVYCQDCKTVFKFVAGPETVAVATFGAGNYMPVETTEGVIADLWMELVVPANWPTGSTSAPTVDGDKVESPKTFDAGIAMYVGMSVMAAAGSAVVLKKKD